MVVRAPPLPDRYRRPRLIGRGGMAEIYRATDDVLSREVAVKVLADDTAEDPDLRARFLREATTAARLSTEPHTVSIYDVGELDGRPFLVMEYLPGGSVADRLAAGRVSREEALTWLGQAALALDRAHARGVVHRDVKPANLLLDASGNLFVADFGIAHADGLESNTRTGMVLGTAGYLSPEQERGATATPASDRYALAVVAHELLTGSRPGATPTEPLPEAANQVFSRWRSARRSGSRRQPISSPRCARRWTRPPHRRGSFDGGGGVLPPCSPRAPSPRGSSPRSPLPSRPTEARRRRRRSRSSRR